ncbi:MAG TPA: hypothetical protein VFA99_03930 [Acidobacteriaceae bacterium]|nr:hypothetical protein [Acidobacteriaceae bacterium]
MEPLTRRSFVEKAGMGLAAASAVGIPPSRSEAQLVYRKSDWNLEPFNRLVHGAALVKQVYDIRAIADGKFLNNVKNSLNGLHFGFGVPEDQIRVVVAMHGPSNMLNFDDAAWQKYRIGELLGVNDPASGSPATRNPFFAKKDTGGSDPNDPSSMLQDTSIEALQSRKAVFLSCHTATEEQVRSFVKSGRMQGEPEAIVKDLQAHLIPGAIVVPAMVAAIAILQTQGHYSYITV